MLPPSGPPSKPQLLIRRKQTVLDEEEYVSILSAIIERDYFPHLSAASAAVRGGHSSSCNEGGFDTTVSVSDAVVRDLSVDSFFKQFTSYDNDSFEDLQQQSVEEHRRKYHWLYEDGISSDSKKGMMMLYHIGDKILTEDERKKMDYILDNGVFGTDDSGLGFGAPVVGDCRPNRTDPWRFRVRNQLMFPPELRDSEDTCGMHDFPVGSAIDHHSMSMMRRSILPAVPSDHPTSNMRITAGAEGGQLQQNMKDALHFAVSTYNRRVGEVSRADKVIQRHNTSIDHDQLLRLVDGTCSSSRFLPMLEPPHTPSLVSSAPSEADSSSSVGDRGKQYRPVPMSPYIEPGQGPMGAVSPLYTWGTIEGPPIPLIHDDALISAMQGSRRVSDNLKRLQQEAYWDQENGVPYFSVQRISQREAMARSMDTSNQQKKAKIARSSHRAPDIQGDTDSVVGRSNYYALASDYNSVRSSSSVHGSAGRRFHSLTPAAQALARRLQSKNKQSSKTTIF